MKKVIILSILVGLIMLGGILFARKITKDLTSKPTAAQREMQMLGGSYISTIDTQTKEVKTNSVSENSVDNTVGETTPKTDLEKAIDIVKEDWGPDTSVYFAQDGTKNGKYIICVRDKASTAALAWYTVNVEDGTFVKE